MMNTIMCVRAGRALAEGNQWYYYSKRTQNRVTANDYWNPMGIKEAAVSNSSNRRVDIKKFYVFYVREAPDVYESDENDGDDDGTGLSCLDEVFLSLDDLDEVSLPN
ncbi:hypothetical protein AHAS_Ahas07G0146900 [Arachis hypogaea]